MPLYIPPVSGASAAEDVTITDTGAYYTGADVEAALQEIGAGGIGGGGGGALEYISGAVVAAGGATTLTITGIPATYKDLVLVAKVRMESTANGEGANIRMGTGGTPDTANYHGYLRFSGWTSGTGTRTTSIPFIAGADADSSAGIRASGIAEIVDYASASTNKIVLGRAYVYDSNGHLLSDSGGSWDNTSAAVDCVQLVATTGDLAEGTTLAVYGRGVGSGASSASFAGCSIKNTSAVSLSNGAYVSMACDAADVYDSDGYHDPSTNNERITIPTDKAGKYLFTGWIMFPGVSNTDRRVAYRINGGSEVIVARDYYSNPGVTLMMPFSFTVDLAVADYVEIRAYVDAGGSSIGASGANIQISRL